MPANTIEIKEITTISGLKAFIRFPFGLYAGNPYWVPALRSDDLNTFRKDKNPAFEFCEAKYWLAYKDGKVAGRVAGIINHRHIEKWKQPFARFGWIDFIDDPHVSAALMKAVEDWARSQGLKAVHGPLGFTDLDREGMLVEGFNELSTLATSYNYPYYPAHMQAAGYAKDIDWVEYELRLPEVLDERIARLSDTLMRRYNLRLLTFKNKKEILRYADALFDLLQEAYQHLYGVTPLSRRQVDAYIKQYFGFMSPDFVPMVVDAQDRLIAFGITLPSLSLALQKSKGRLFPFGFIHLLRALRKNDKGDLYLVAVSHEYQGRGVNAILINRMIEVFREFGIKSVESNPELENNLRVQAQWKNFDHRQHKRRRIFIKLLNL
ncbi:MAG: GNAT family N-acetyltransferase [Anaerolineaceae bacterium]|nr:GNAT family N-acetyltransferase [Anaerolineaceae bacterium]